MTQTKIIISLSLVFFSRALKLGASVSQEKRGGRLLLSESTTKFHPVVYELTLGTATVHNEKCSRSSYTPSVLEANFKRNVLVLTEKKEKWCSALQTTTKSWLNQLEGKTPMETKGEIFSHLCKTGSDLQLIEPLAGILRDPRQFCDHHDFLMNVNWISLADASILRGGKNILFDAGGTHFADAMKFFTHAYERRGIVLDKIYVWEATLSSEAAYWKGVSPEDQGKWRSKITFYNGVPVVATRGHKDNVVDRILQECEPEDFCAFKLDIDTPSVEIALVSQLMEQSKEVSSKLDEFFFEHHVHGVMQQYWGRHVNLTFADSYNIFTQLRQLGVRAHSWV